MPPSKSLRFSHDSGSLIPPWAFWRSNPPRFLSLSQKPTGFLRDLRMLPTVKPAFLRRMEKLPFRRSGDSSRSLCISSKLWGPLRLPDLLGSSGPILRFHFFFHRKEAPGYAYLAQVTATGWTLSTIEDSKVLPSSRVHGFWKASNGASMGSSQGRGSPEYA